MDEFLRFVVERHRIWELRQAGAPQPWTSDPILATRKFTNVFRVLDPGTQFVMTDLLEPGLEERDQLMRMFLYRHTGRVEVWQALNLTVGYPTVGSLDEVRSVFNTYRGEPKTIMKKPWAQPVATYTGPWHEAKSYPKQIFTGAYLVFPQSDTPGTDKLDSVIGLTKRLFTPGSPDDIMPKWERARSQAERYKILRSNKGVGDFMAMQVLTDWGYGQDVDREEEFLQPGPGSVRGAKALIPNASTMTVVKRVVGEVRALPQCPRLGYRVPSLMDIGSNLLCEWSKYVRFKGQAVPVKTYTPAHPGPQEPPVLPSYYTEGLL